MILWILNDCTWLFVCVYVCVCENPWDHFYMYVCFFPLKFWKCRMLIEIINPRATNHPSKSPNGMNSKSKWPCSKHPLTKQTNQPRTKQQRSEVSILKHICVPCILSWLMHWTRGIWQTLFCRYLLWWQINKWNKWITKHSHSHLCLFHIQSGLLQSDQRLVTKRRTSFTRCNMQQGD